MTPDPDPGNCIQCTDGGKAWTCKHREEDQPEYSVVYDEDGNPHYYYRDVSPMFPEEENKSGKSGSDPADDEIEQSVPVIVPCSEGPSWLRR